MISKKLHIISMQSVPQELIEPFVTASSLLSLRLLTRHTGGGGARCNRTSLQLSRLMRTTFSRSFHVRSQQRQGRTAFAAHVGSSRGLADLRVLGVCPPLPPATLRSARLGAGTACTQKARLIATSAGATTASLATGTVVKVPEAGSEIRWGSFLSTEESLEAAVDEAVRTIKDSIGEDAKPELALVFVSSLHGEEFDRVVPLLRERVPSLRHIFGCSGYGVIGGGKQGPVEEEGGPAFSLTLGQLPGAEIRVLHTLRSSIPREDASPEDWAEFVGVPHDTPKPVSFVMLADPRFSQITDLVAGLDYAFPNAPKIGGILSTGTGIKNRAMFAWSASGAPRRRNRKDRAGRRRLSGRSGPSPASITVLSKPQRQGRPGGGRSPGVQDLRALLSGLLDVPPEALNISKEDEQKLLRKLLEASKDPAAGWDSSDDEEEGEEAGGASTSKQAPGKAGTEDSRQKQQQQQAEARSKAQGSADDSSSQTSSSTSSSSSSSSSSGKQGQGMFGMLLSKLTGSNKGQKDSKAGDSSRDATSTSRSDQESDEDNAEEGSEDEGANSPRQRRLRPAASARTFSDAVLSFIEKGPGSRQRLGRGRGAGDDEDTTSSAMSNTSGMYLYGCVMLAIHGEVQLDTFTTMGYRAPSPRVWRIEKVTDSNEILSVIPEDLAESAAAGKPGASGSVASSSRSRLMSDDSDEDDSDDDIDLEEGPELQAIGVVIEMLDWLKDTDPDDWQELLENAAIAVAADTSKPVSELGPDDWEILPLEDVNEEYGILTVGSPPVVNGGTDLRRGHRLKLLIRDDRGAREDLRDSLLQFKRKDLGAMMSGQSVPPSFGLLMFTDIDRGIECYKEENYESGVAHTYIPAPVSGLFGGGQLGRVQGAGSGTAAYEYATVVGVLRAATERSSAALKRAAQARASAAAAAAEELQRSKDAADAAQAAGDAAQTQQEGDTQQQSPEAGKSGGDSNGSDSKGSSGGGNGSGSQS